MQITRASTRPADTGSATVMMCLYTRAGYFLLLPIQDNVEPTVFVTLWKSFHLHYVLIVMISKYICNGVNDIKISYELHFRFGKHYSTILALMEVIDNICHHLDRHEYVIGMFVDLPKKHLTQ